MFRIQHYLRPPSAKHRQHVAHLYSLRREAIIIQRKNVNQGNWLPQEKICHQNCTDWVDFNFRDTAIRGWLCMDFSIYGFYRFASHSIIRTASGDFIDITPTKIITLFPFLEDSLEEEEYSECIEILQSVYGCTFLDYRI